MEENDTQPGIEPLILELIGEPPDEEKLSAARSLLPELLSYVPRRYHDEVLEAYCRGAGDDRDVCTAAAVVLWEHELSRRGSKARTELRKIMARERRAVSHGPDRSSV